MLINPSLSGRHLIIDLLSNDYTLLNDTKYAEEYIYKVTEICDMQLVMPVISMKFPFNSELTGFVKKLIKEGTTSPVVEEYTKYVLMKETDDVGVSSFGIWNTSHTSSHSWSEYDYLSLDMYSCNDFNADPIIEFTKEYYNAKRVDVVNMLRYVGSPQKIEQFTWEQ